MVAVEKSKAELIKLESNGLRGSLQEELNDPEVKKFTNANEQLLKFHGMYQQKDRDRRKPEERHLGPKPFSVMIRGRIPGGRMSARQWLAWDNMASAYATSGLRITTRQSLQLHGVLKGDIKGILKSLHEVLSHTTGACGDVVRNVTQAVNPWGDDRLQQLDEPTELLSKHFEVKTPAYLEIFLDGEPVVSDPEDRIYGQAYLPRKFKIGITAEGNNSIDILTHDLGLVATFDSNRKLDGYFVVVGGGMGQSHSDPNTRARLADNLGWIAKRHLLPVAEAVVTTQRDFGNRQDRAFARLKYLIDREGLDWFKNEVEKRAQVTFENRPLPAWQTPSSLGWFERTDGTLALGFHILSGRIVDSERRPMRTTLRQIIEKYELDIQLTAEQDLILLGIKPEDRKAIEGFLDSHGMSPASPQKVFERALTCVALPTCSKALAESERIGHELFSTIHDALQKYGLNDRAPIARITGCPNGCARPYTAEIALVGQMPGKYALFLGGDPEGTRLAEKVADKVAQKDFPEVFDKIFSFWREHSHGQERLGDFVQRSGVEAIGAIL